MKKFVILLAVCIVGSTPLRPQGDSRDVRWSGCMDACSLERPNAELQRQEVIVLEKEAAHAILLGDATFFRRVYSDDFSGVLSRGGNVDKASFIAAVQAPGVTYESFAATDIKVRLYRDTAVASGTWSFRAIIKGQRVSTQMRVLHVYFYSGAGYHVISGQVTSLPPYVEQPL